MYNSNPYSAYKAQDLETSSNYELVGKLFGAASLKLKKAVMGIHENKLDLANNEIIKAQIIVTTLNESLDMSFGIASQLRPLYLYMIRRMREANINKDPKILAEISAMLDQFRDTWNEALKRFKIAQACSADITKDAGPHFYNS
jgi:flagellar protein FliS